MNTLTDPGNPPAIDAAAADSAPFFIRGKLVEGCDLIQRSRDLGVDFATPRLNLDAVVHPRTELPPLLNVKISEIIDFLVEAGQRLTSGNNPHVEACIERMAKVSLAPRSVIEHQMLHATDYLDRKVLEEVLEQNFPDPKALDEWIPHTDHQGRRSFIRAFAPRLVHVLPGNSPGMGIRSIAQSALVKSVSLFKMPSADPFSTVAFLRTMAEIDPDQDAGGLYETNGRSWVSQPKPEDVKRWFKPGQWNEMTVSARGGHIVVHVNGIKTAELKDDPGRREGKLALQVHGGQDCEVWFKDIEITTE